jgi:Cu2+-containing amine oxidase
VNGHRCICGQSRPLARAARGSRQVYNYDYICDFNFYIDGTLEPRVQTSG